MSRPPTTAFTVIVGGAIFWIILVLIALAIFGVIDWPVIDSEDDARPERFQPPSGGG